MESEEATEDVSNIVLNSKEEDENFTVPHITTQNSSLRSKIERLEVIPGEDNMDIKQKSRNSSQSSQSSGFKLRYMNTFQDDFSQY